MAALLQGQFFTSLKTSGVNAFYFFLLGGEDLGVGKAKAQKRSEAWQLGSRVVGWLWGRGGNGSGWDRTPWPWKRTYMENAWGKSLIQCLFFLKLASHVSFHNCFFVDSFCATMSFVGTQKKSTNIDLVFNGGCVASSLNITIIFFCMSSKNPSDKKTHADFFLGVSGPFARIPTCSSHLKAIVTG